MFRKTVSIIVLTLVCVGLFSTAAFAQGRKPDTAGKGGQGSGKHGTTLVSADAKDSTGSKGNKGSGSSGSIIPGRKDMTDKKGGGANSAVQVKIKVSLNKPIYADGTTGLRTDLIGGTVYLVKESESVMAMQKITSDNYNEVIELTGIGYGDYQVMVVKKGANSIDCFEGLDTDTLNDFINYYTDDIVAYLTYGTYPIGNPNFKQLFNDFVGVETITPYAGAENTVSVTAAQKNWLPIYNLMPTNTELPQVQVVNFSECLGNLWDSYDGIVKEE